ncbi:uncharacterized protein LOC125372063 isoform X2 [Haliotis rufescens]|uniref:uncharacterized protein LOC125372063 isoform X2 n=1 Tax=Haliotis rufescens TaxID=6454 RepID=UPI00201EB6A9|nr:uncharacterized protein LOC125372063 isoform X2 [Haliotis rufescens]
MVKHCHFNMMYIRTTCVFFGIMSWACFWIYGVDGTSTVIEREAGSDVILECEGVSKKAAIWYMPDIDGYVVDMFEGPEGCKIRYGNPRRSELSLGSTNCRKHALKISNISKVHEGNWKCQIQGVTRSIDVNVLARSAEQTTEVTTTTSSSPRAKVTSTSAAQATTTSTAPGSTHSTNEPTTSVTDTSSTGFKNERTEDSTNPQTPPVNSMLPLLGGTIGGALVLLAAVITVCCLLRSRKQRQTDGSTERPVKGHPRNQDPEQREDAVMVGNPIYSSYDGDVDYAQIGGARQTASTKDPQASPGTSQEVTDIYAIPDKQRSSTLNAEAVACDVYSVVQKQPKSEGVDMVVTRDSVCNQGRFEIEATYY